MGNKYQLMIHMISRYKYGQVELGVRRDVLSARWLSSVGGSAIENEQMAMPSLTPLGQSSPWEIEWHRYSMSLTIGSRRAAGKHL
jgi:hypothetical protein